MKKKYLVLLEKKGRFKYFILNSEDKDFVKNLKPSVVNDVEQVIAIDFVNKKVVFCKSNSKKEEFLNNPIYIKGLALVSAQYGIEDVNFEILDYTEDFN